MTPRTYDDWKTTNPEDEWLGDDPAERDPDEEREQERDDALWDKQTSTGLEAMWGTKRPSHQAWWYHHVWLPNARKALRREPHDVALLAGVGHEQANDDQMWDNSAGENWE